MIKKSLLITLALFTSYSIYLLAGRHDFDHAQYNYQENIIKADKFLYSNNNVNVVILGTSLSNRIITDSLPGTYNLSMSGMSLFDGAKVLLKCKQMPSVVFIEINYLNKPTNESFQNTFNNDNVIYLKQNLPALRDENQPMGISYSIMKDVLKIGQQKPNNTHLDTDIFKIALGDWKRVYNAPDTPSIKNGINKLKDLVVELKKRGSKVCFFEMPVNPELETLPLAQMVHNAILRNFPETKFIPTPQVKFITTDGVHLGKEEALAYTKYFKSVSQE